MEYVVEKSEFLPNIKVLSHLPVGDALTVG